MENELVKTTEQYCKNIYDALFEKHTVESNSGAGSLITDELIDDMYKSIKIVEGLNESNVAERFGMAAELDKEVTRKYGFTKSLLPTSQPAQTAAPTQTTTPNNINQPTTTTASDDEKYTKALVTEIAVFGSLLTILGAAVAVHTGLPDRVDRVNVDLDTETVQEADIDRHAENEDSNSEESSKELDNESKEEEKKEETSEEEKKEETSEEEKKETSEESKEETSEESKEEEVQNEEQLVAGEYGTFFDVTDPEQVQARAQYIYDTYFANYSLTAEQKQIITVDNIANTIRVFNDENALDQNGEAVHIAGLTVNEYAKTLIEIAVNACRDANGTYHYFPGYLLFVDGTEESDFVKSYQEPYEKLVYALNEHDDEQARDAIACLGFKFDKEWYLQGMYGDANPHFYRTDLKALLFQTTVLPYQATAVEWHGSTLDPVCIHACIDPQTGEEGLINVNNLVEALITGRWNLINTKYAGQTEIPNPWLEDYYQVLESSLAWKFDHRNVLVPTSGK